MPAGEPPGGAGHPRRGRPRLSAAIWAVPRYIALLTVGVAYALVAAATTAFTGSADLVTALPIVVLAVLVVVRWPLRARRRPPRRTDTDGHRPGSHPWRAWVGLFAAIVAWELAEYVARGSRADHPTLSSMLDAVDRHYALKALVFFLWLYLGAAIVRRGGRRRGGVTEAVEPP